MPDDERPDLDPSLLVVAAVLSRDRDLLRRARPHARRTRDRQLIDLADALLRGDADLLDGLVREHLAAYPDQPLASWIAGLIPHPSLSTSPSITAPEESQP